MAFFTSGLSVNEFALLDRLGPQPLTQVMGASVIRAGWQYLPPLEPGKAFISSAGYTRGGVPTAVGSQLTNVYTEASLSQVRNYKSRADVVCELDTLTAAWNMARRQALDHMREEALQVGADAVVGVHLERSDHELGRNVIEFVVRGTAIRIPGSAGTDAPMLTDVSVQDYWRLRSAGHEPVGLVATTGVVFASPSRRKRMARVRTTARNQELTELSEAFQLARETVRGQLKDQTAHARATGCVGVEFAHDIHQQVFGLASSIQTADRRGWHRGRLGLPYKVTGASGAKRAGWVITMHAAGTAIRHNAAVKPAETKTQLRLGTTK